MKTPKMSTQELGLILGQQLVGTHDLHYGLWDDDLPLGIANLAKAQQRYNDIILSALPPANNGHTRVLDIGCGTGHLLMHLKTLGYLADGLVPSKCLANLVKKRFSTLPGTPPKLFECKLEDFSVDGYQAYYDAVLFSESFQYIPMQKAFPILCRILKPGGYVVICDFFKTASAGDGGPGDRSFGGGHDLKRFYRILDEYKHYKILQDEDITKKVSPNIDLVDDILMNRIVPAGRTLDLFLSSNYRFIYKPLKFFIKMLLNKKINRNKYKYFSGNRTRAVFEQYKSYRFVVLQYVPGDSN